MQIAHTGVDTDELPTFASAHMFSITQRMVKHHACPGVDINALSYSTKYRSTMKAKFFYAEKMKFNEAVLRIAANHSLLMSSS